jgi:hypothetical protein
MLIPSFFIPQEKNILSPAGIAFPSGAYPVLKLILDDADAEHNHALYESAFRGNLPTPFCLLIEVNSRPMELPQLERYAENAVAFAYHANYLNRSFNTPFLIFTHAGDSLPHIIAAFRKKFQAQGFADIEYTIIPGDNRFPDSPDAERSVVISQTDAEPPIADAYASLFAGQQADENILLIYFSSTEQLTGLISELTKAEARLADTSPIVHSLLSRNAALKKEHARLLTEKGLLKEELGSLKNYYSFYNLPESGYRKKVNELVEFYKYEYEILPLWYKRFGHLIKVLTGKRTFRSLFNDNVKKYKA